MAVLNRRWRGGILPHAEKVDEAPGPPGFAELHAVLRGVLGVLFPGRELRNVDVLMSRPGCAAQPKHTDLAFPSAESGEWMARTTAARDAPLLFFVAVQRTSVRKWPHSWRNVHEALATRGEGPFTLPSGGRVERVVLETGDMLVFRGDQVHAGDAYEGGENNFRIHGFLHSDGPLGMAHKPNQTNVLGRPGSCFEALDRLLLEVERATTEEEDLEEDIEYEVGKISACRHTDRGAEYRVQWKGWNDVTWEPLENLTGAGHAVAEFHRRHGGPVSPRKKRRTG
ncbi:hypothetical protein DFJ74DRAFT_767486 [Hyaloraphidium curvatum]|nr:hypothetical protein DFJ74DRAFT_767486 [Hyaloraphidium curvatum]